MNKGIRLFGVWLMVGSLCLGNLLTFATEAQPLPEETAIVQEQQSQEPEQPQTPTEKNLSKVDDLLRGTPDKLPPELISVTLDKTEVTAPGVGRQ